MLGWGQGPAKQTILELYKKIPIIKITKSIIKVFKFKMNKPLNFIFSLFGLFSAQLSGLFLGFYF